MFDITRPQSGQKGDLWQGPPYLSGAPGNGGGCSPPVRGDVEAAGN